MGFEMHSERMHCFAWANGGRERTPCCNTECTCLWSPYV